MHARHSAQETTKAGRVAFLARFEREVDPDGTLPIEERARRAECAKRAYFVALVMRRHKNRARKRAASREERAA
jgi:hypothetical protein